MTLAREADISHLDDSPIHILTTASLAWLKKALPNSVIDEKRLRANIIINVSGDTLIEHGWVGKHIQIGNNVTLKVTKLAERCVMTLGKQKDLAHDSRIFRHIVQQSENMFGVYARVVSCGEVNLFDEVHVLN